MRGTLKEIEPCFTFVSGPGTDAADAGHIETCFTSEDPLRLTQADTPPQFGLPGEDVDQPRYTSFGSAQGIG